MKLKYLLILTIILSDQLQAQIQKNDTLKKTNLLKQSILPASLIGVGFIINKSSFDKTFQKDIRNNVGLNYKTNVEDYLAFAPVAQMYLADLAGIKSKNNWFDQGKYLFISNLFSVGITQLIKKSNQKLRPDGTPDSFPSGHSTIAFTNATVLYHEFHNSSPVLAYSGYAFAATVGYFRMANNKHYLSDVLVGAGIGIAVTNLVYYFKPLKNFNPFKKVKNVSIYPAYKDNSYGLYASCQF
jgi:membrane-associated phospholipid phosphatase